jgi:hypothetical protein
MGPPVRVGLCLTAVAIAVASASARAAPPGEDIVNLHAEMTIGRDGRADVEETILVWAAGARIRSGIDRDIPTDAVGPDGARTTMEIEGLTVTRDGQPEAFRRESIAGAERVHLGDDATALSLGTHVYVIAYHTSGQVAFLADRDQLAWHIAGVGRALPIEQASAAIFLPEPAARRLTGLTTIAEPRGAPDPTVVASRREMAAAMAAVFTTTRPLGPGEGLTLVVSWPQGILHPPAVAPAARAWRSSRAAALVALAAGLAFLQALWVGRRRRRGRPGGGVLLSALGLGALVAGGPAGWLRTGALALGVLVATRLGFDTARAGLKLAGPAGRLRYGARARPRAWAGGILTLGLAALGVAGLLAFGRLTSLASTLVLAATVAVGAWGRAPRR